MPAALIIMIGLTMSGAAHAEETTCAALDRHANDTGVRIPGYDAGRDVIGKGRVQFYSGPDLKCEISGVFVVPGDRVIAYVESNGFTAVLYLNPRTQEDTLGWVISARLRRNGRGIAPRQ